jgi:hypothetical protein
LNLPGLISKPSVFQPVSGRCKDYAIAALGKEIERKDMTNKICKYPHEHNVCCCIIAIAAKRAYKPTYEVYVNVEPGWRGDMKQANKQT